MAKRRKRKQQTSIFGAILLESIAFIGIICLFFTMQDHRASAVSVDELVHPRSTMTEQSANPNQPPTFEVQLGPDPIHFVEAPVVRSSADGYSSRRTHDPNAPQRLVYSYPADNHQW